MVTVETLSIVFTGLSISLAAFYYISTLRNAQRTQQLQLETRKTQVFMQIYEQLNSEESNKTFMELMYLDIEDNEEYLRKYDSSVNPAHYAKRAQLFYNYNAIGELLRGGIIDSDLIHRLLLDFQVIMMWEKWEHIIRETREREKIPDLWEGFEYLYSEMKEYRNMKGYPDPVLTPQDYIS
jgi:hypothetical protein